MGQQCAIKSVIILLKFNCNHQLTKVFTNLPVYNINGHQIQGMVDDEIIFYQYSAEEGEALIVILTIM